MAEGPWNDKKILKDNNTITERYWLKNRNAEGGHDTVIGFSFPGDSGRVFDYDITGNILWGYRTRAAGKEIYEVGMRGNDTDNTGKHLSAQESKSDNAAIAFGAYLYKKYGDNITTEILQREILAASGLNVHNRAELQEKFHKVKQGDTFFDIAKQNGISTEQLVKLNPQITNPNKLPIGATINLPTPDKAIPDPATLKKLKASGAITPRQVDDIYKQAYDSPHHLAPMPAQYSEDSSNNGGKDFADTASDGSSDTPTGTAFYVWRTRHDTHVRPLHRDYDGHVFAWGDPPADGHPGDANGCRCRAEPFHESNVLYHDTPTPTKTNLDYSRHAARP
ncbi:MAG: LysM peptidoglycan-binding domain-containing protein [Hydrotalea sp.]|nr:LysM peptidoglycan-binding domain-containing protein [Hydrotalea sp.]